MQEQREIVVIDREGNIQVWRDHTKRWHWIKKCRAAAHFNHEKRTEQDQGKNGN